MCFFLKDPYRPFPRVVLALSRWSESGRMAGSAPNTPEPGPQESLLTTTLEPQLTSLVVEGVSVQHLSSVVCTDHSSNASALAQGLERPNTYPSTQTFSHKNSIR